MPKRKEKQREKGCLCTDWNEPYLRNCINCKKQYKGIKGQKSMEDCPIHREQIGCMCDFGLISMCPECRTGNK